MRKLMNILILLALSSTAYGQATRPPLRIYDESTRLGLAYKLSFAGAGVACTGPTLGVITCTIGGGGAGGVDLQASSPGTQQTGNINVSGRVLTGDGSDALPGWAFASDPSMGCSRNAANVLRCAGGSGGQAFTLSAAGLQAPTIAATGNVGTNSVTRQNGGDVGMWEDAGTYAANMGHANRTWNFLGAETHGGAVDFTSGGVRGVRIEGVGGGFGKVIWATAGGSGDTYLRRAGAATLQLWDEGTGGGLMLGSDTRFYRSGVNSVTLDRGSGGAANLDLGGGNMSAGEMIGTNFSAPGGNPAPFGYGAKMVSGAKGTCDSTIPGTLRYEVAANVGTLYGCVQTGVGTYAWAALH